MFLIFVFRQGARIKEEETDATRIKTQKIHAKVLSRNVKHNNYFGKLSLDAR